MAKRRKKDQDGTKEIDSEAQDRTLFRALKDAFEWAIDIAAGLARDYPEEVEAVERLRAYLRAWLAGNRATVPLQDVLFVLALLMSAIERGCGAIGLGAAGAAPSIPLRLPGSPTGLPFVPRVFVRAWPRSTSAHIALA